jgi:hypothetical protein
MRHRPQIRVGWTQAEGTLFAGTSPARRVGGPGRLTLAKPDSEAAVAAPGSESDFKLIRRAGIGLGEQLPGSDADVWITVQVINASSRSQPLPARSRPTPATGPGRGATPAAPAVERRRNRDRRTRRSASRRSWPGHSLKGSSIML